MNYITDKERILDIALLTGRILIENGAEISRVKETIKRICKSYDISSENAFTVNSGIFLTAGGKGEPLYAKLQDIPSNGTRLDRIMAISQFSREFIEKKYTLDEAEKKLEEIRTMPKRKESIIVLFSGIGAAAWTAFFGGGIPETACSFIIGMILVLFLDLFASKHLSKFAGTIFGSILLTACSCLLCLIVPSLNGTPIIIGDIMPLIPGIALVNAIRDFTSEDYLTGTVRLIDAILGFLGIAIGVYMVILLFSSITGGALL